MQTAQDRANPSMVTLRQLEAPSGGFIDVNVALSSHEPHIQAMMCAKLIYN